MLLPMSGTASSDQSYLHLYIAKILGIILHFGQVFGLHQNCVEVRVSQPELEIDFFRILQVSIGPKTGSSLFSYEVLSVGCGHFLGTPKQLTVQR
jgi:hypothetical protein